MIKFVKCESDNEYMDIELMASIIWPITYKSILTFEQINYMLNKFLSVNAIKNNIQNENYIYEIIYENDEKIGFIAYKFCELDYLFLSKLYILPNFQKNGFGKKAIEYLGGNNLPIRLTVNKYNKNAYDMYLHIGFEQIDSIISDIGNNYVMDDYVMELKLKRLC